MSRRPMRFLVLSVLAIALVALGGCGLKATVTVESDGSGTVGYAFLMPEGLLGMSEGGEGDLSTAVEDAQEAADEQGVTVEEVKDGDEAGIGWTAEFEDADEFGDAIERLNTAMSASEDAEDAGAGQPPFASGELEVKRGIFSNSYTVTIEYEPTTDASSLGEEYEGMSGEELEALMGQMGLTSQVVVTMPGDVTDTNGEIDEDEPTVATFDLPLYGGEARTLEVVSKQTNWLVLGILIGVGVLVLLVAAFLLVRSAAAKRQKAAPVVPVAYAPVAAAAPVDYAPVAAPAPAPEAAPAPEPPAASAFCANCGAPRPADGAFCPTCGTPLA